MSVPIIYWFRLLPPVGSDILVSFLLAIVLLGFRTLVQIFLIRLRVFRESSTESLILAQDERWRRA